MENNTNTRPVSIYMEANPNPNSLKFVTNSMLVEDGESFDFPTLESASDSPLAQELFKKFDFVERVFFMSNFVTVTKNETTEWEEVNTQIKEFIIAELEKGTDVIIPEAIQETAQAAEEASQEDSEVVKQIKGILDEYIRPAVESDGGAITFHSYKDGVVKVLLQGACSGCPSSTVTLKAGIENLFKRMLPNDVTSVEAEGV